MYKYTVVESLCTEINIVIGYHDERTPHTLKIHQRI